ncbi:MAG: hypothetical protein WBV82_25675, partial [Myxococcaceae bacterium]
MLLFIGMSLPLILFVLATAPTQAEFVVPGRHHGDEVAALDGDRFLALCGGELRDVQIRVESFRDEIVDSPEERTGKEITAPCAAIFLVRGVDRLEPDRIRTATLSVEKLIQGPGISGPAQVVLAMGDLRATVRFEAIAGQGYRLVLDEGPRSSTLYETRQWDGGKWNVVWAGDLDRDGGLDLLITGSAHYNVTVHRLLLS